MNPEIKVMILNPGALVMIPINGEIIRIPAPIFSIPLDNLTSRVLILSGV